jgi:hypothetical protein
MMCLFALLGFAGLSATAVKKSNVIVDNMSSTITKAGKTKAPKAGKQAVQVCGETFTNQKVSLSNDLDCGARIGDKENCAVTLDGPGAEIDCQGNTLSQVATPSGYTNGPFFFGICLNDGAVARNCNVEKFKNGIRVTEGGEVRSSFLTSNFSGIVAYFGEDSNSTLTIEDT